MNRHTMIAHHAHAPDRHAHVYLAVYPYAYIVASFTVTSHFINATHTHAASSQDAIREAGAIDSAFDLLSHQEADIRELAVSLIWAATSGNRTHKSHHSLI